MKNFEFLIKILEYMRRKNRHEDVKNVFQNT